MSDSILKEAKRLYDLGMAIHWLHAKSKRPVESGWTTGPRKTWADLRATYKKGMNVGVRLGRPSKIKGDFLAVIDVDVKSSEGKHAQEVARELKRLTGTLTLPEVRSGRGNGSRHYYVLTKEPVKPFKALQSSDVVKVPMPSVTPSKRELKALTADELASGLRLRPAWEIAVMGDGQQVVLPPSIHPDSGLSYAWRSQFAHETATGFDLGVMQNALPKENVDKSVDNSGKEKAKPGPKSVENFTPVEVPVEWLNVSDKIKNMIISGEGVEDRSAMLLPISTALLKAGLSQNEILSVLTDTEYFIGQTGYHHAKTKDRKRAAQWVYRYTLRKVESDNAAENFFNNVNETGVPAAEELSFLEMGEEQLEFEEGEDWRLTLDTTKDDNVRGTLKNVVTVLKNDVSESMIRRDVFATRDYWTLDTPWGCKEDAAIGDDDVVRTKLWLAENFNFEPNKNILSEAFTVMACENTFDPVKDWLENLPAWDGRERLDTWLKDHFHAKGDPDYLAQVFRKWLCAMVMRVYKPGMKFDWMPIFEGKQGVGKSSFGRILCGDKYFLDSLPELQDKDAALALQGIWAVEMGELASFRKNEIEIVKAFVTRTVDKVRPPYGERWIESPRRCVFFGTTNFETYLRDDSGNRRFKPVKVGKLDFEALENDRNQLFAEALWLFKNGFESERTLEITGSAKVYEATIQSEKMVSDESALMQETLYDFINVEAEKTDDEKFNLSKFKINELFGHVTPSLNAFKTSTPPLKNWKYDSRNVQFAAKALKNLGARNWKSHGVKYWRLTI